MVFSTVQSTADGFLPFRSIVKKLSGASRHEAKISRLVDQGRLRKAYLLGFKASMGCTPAVMPSSEVVADIPKQN